jgi:hypothetical protein
LNTGCFAEPGKPYIGDKDPNIRSGINFLLSPEGLYLQYKVSQVLQNNLYSILNRLPVNIIEAPFDNAAVQVDIDLQSLGITEISIPGEDPINGTIPFIVVLETASIYKRNPIFLRYFVDSYINTYPDFWRVPDVAVYYAGAYRQVIDMLARAGIPAVLIDDTFPLSELLNYKLIIFPSGSLAYKPDMTAFTS